MTVELALYQPDIPQNTGTLMRLSACLGFRLHIIHPTGFTWSPTALRRSGMDYLADARIQEHDSFRQFEDWRHEESRRLVLLTTGGDMDVYRFAYRKSDVLMAGRESAGVPTEVARSSDARVRIKMCAGLRSINVAVAASMVIGEAMRQTEGFDGLI